MKAVFEKKLKGGSLSSTELYSSAGKLFVRKSIDSSSEREYGFIRWYSQMKKIQKYNLLFPGLVPELINCDIQGQTAYFDIEYIDGKDLKTLFTLNEIEDVHSLNNELWNAFELVHGNTYAPNTGSLRLYFLEEVVRKLNESLLYPEFKIFFDKDVYYFFDQPVCGIKGQLEKLQKLFNRPITSESCIFGNPTLENILYNPKTKKITFIDLYEESMVDSKFLDFSQVLQCSRSHYSFHNEATIKIDDNRVASDAQIPQQLYTFNELYIDALRSRYTPDELSLIDLFEATQFIRMLPFKCKGGNVDGAKFFYVKACFLVNRLL